MGITSNELIEKFIKEHGKDFPDVSAKEIKVIINFPFNCFRRLLKQNKIESFYISEHKKIDLSTYEARVNLKDDLNIPISDKGDLTCWAKEGVLLLNSVLTVEKDKPASHKNLGWENFTDAIIKKINEKDTPVVFILWGNFAKSKKSLITNPKHLVLESSHPSPFSCNYGFFGSRPFSKTNKFLKEHNLKEIDFTVR